MLTASWRACSSHVFQMDMEMSGGTFRKHWECSVKLKCCMFPFRNPSQQIRIWKTALVRCWKVSWSSYIFSVPNPRLKGICTVRIDYYMHLMHGIWKRRRKKRKRAKMMGSITMSAAPLQLWLQILTHCFFVCFFLIIKKHMFGCICGGIAYDENKLLYEHECLCA